MAAKLTRLTHKIAIQLYLVAESYTICSFGSRRPVRKLLDTLSYSLSYRTRQVFVLIIQITMERQLGEIFYIFRHNPLYC